MTKFMSEVLMLGGSRVDGVHWFPVDGLDRPYAVDNGNAIYVFLPRTSDPEEMEATKMNLDYIKLVKSSSPLIAMDEGFKLFSTCRAHTQQALEFLNSIFAAAIANPEFFYTDA